ncbi:arginase family protein [Candidatus Pacearchaeota archaeon]|nr:arginase family protein [Candidatus Pacearchaeota archaeon]
MFIVKVPQTNSEDEKGCERSGEEIIKELRKIAANESGNEIDVDSLDLEEIHLDNSDLKLSHDLIYRNSLEIFELKPKTIFLGGDHSITSPILTAFREYCENSKTEPRLVVFDSHPDCMETNGKFPTNTEWLRKLIEDGFPTENMLLVGIRNSNKNENNSLKENKIKIMRMNAITENLHEACDTIMEFSGGKELYVSIDISVLDSVFAPATHYHEAGGLSGREFLYIIQRINKIKNLRAIDIVEINEKKDKESKNMTIKLGAKIVSELIG